MLCCVVVINTESLTLSNRGVSANCLGAGVTVEPCSFGSENKIILKSVYIRLPDGNLLLWDRD